jgi:site-specific recombinase XerD
VTLHEARHTYASFLMAAGYNLKQIQEYLGHADLVTTGRYIKKSSGSARHHRAGICPN